MQRQIETHRFVGGRYIEAQYRPTFTDGETKFLGADVRLVNLTARPPYMAPADAAERLKLRLLALTEVI